MLPLKKRLTNDLGRSILEAQKRLDILNAAAVALPKVRLARAEFQVQIRSCWAHEGEKNTEITHRGKLEEAIHIAQEDFKKANNRSDVQGDWFVFIILEDHKLEVPKEYWKDFTPYHA